MTPMEVLQQNLSEMRRENTALKLTIANQRAQLQTLNGVLAKRKFAARKMKAALTEYRRNDPTLPKYKLTHEMA